VHKQFEEVRVAAPLRLGEQFRDLGRQTVWVLP
jgi:hypothetical protein